jgi:hypothetical protein
MAVSGGSWSASMRGRSCSRDTLERVQFDITVAESRMGRKRKKRLRKSAESGMRAREEEDGGKVKS